MNEEFIIRKLLKSKIRGVDNYKHNGSTWLIFTSEKKWVVELTPQGTLWYNYYFFSEIFNFVGLDVVENQHYITKWVEDTVINGVKFTKGEYYKEIQKVEYTIENGVKETRHNPFEDGLAMEEAIQNGVKHTEKSLRIDYSCVIEDTIQNGVKHTQGSIFDNPTTVKDTIQNGVKYTGDRQGNYNLVVEDTIQNGVKHTDFLGPGRPEMIEKVIENGIKEIESIASHRTWKSDKVIQYGIKETNPHFLEILNPLNFESEFIEMKRINEVNIVLESGIKETKSPFDQNFEDTLDFLDSNNTTSVPELIDRVIDNGIKETTPGGYLGFVEKKGKKIHQFETAKQLYYVEDVIESGIKKTEGAMLFDESQIDRVISDGIKETHDDVMPHKGRVEGVIKNGVKETVDALSSRLPNPVGDVIKNGVKECIPIWHTIYNPMDFSVEYRENHRKDDVASVLEKGIKEVQPLPAQDGNRDWGIYYHRQEVPTKPHTQYVDDVITNGIKETKPMDEWVNTERILDGVIERGEKC